MRGRGRPIEVCDEFLEELVALHRKNPDTAAGVLSKRAGIDLVSAWRVIGMLVADARPTRHHRPKLSAKAPYRCPERDAHLCRGARLRDCARSGVAACPLSACVKGPLRRPDR